MILWTVATESNVYTQTIILQTKIEELPKLYDWLNEQLQNKVDEKIKAHILLVAQELATNSMIHGNAMDAQKEVKIEVVYFDSEIKLIITDQGSNDYSLPSLEESLQMDILEEGGRGLKLAMRLAKEIKKEKSSLHITFEISD